MIDEKGCIVNELTVSNVGLRAHQLHHILRCRVLSELALDKGECSWIRIVQGVENRAIF